MNQRMQDALNAQVNAELYSAYLYLSMVAHFEAINLPGFAHWMRIQTMEEVFHAMKIFDFINERGGRAVLQPIEGPPVEFGSPLDIIQAAYAHEQHITGLIHALYDLATEEKDHATRVMLEWFVTEQVEEEKNASTIVDQLQMIGDNPQSLFMLDRELGARVLSPMIATAILGGGTAAAAG